MHSVTSPTQTPPHLPLVQPAVTEEELQTESQQYNCPITGRENPAGTSLPILQGANPTTGVPSGRLVTSPMELTLWRRNYFFLILAHSVYKMLII